ncbi:glycine-rich domain-containing protein [Actinomadura hibisca]|uniref:glycine-rich domain-containing protein n=1 Tax=Actinomadura hibisca TaxID=68565 RepID=UPI000831D11C|nr:hypothetical protein [Actinomadura hibisca]
MTVTAERTGPALATDPRDLVSPDLFDRLTASIVKDHGVTPEYAERIMRQALVFLVASIDRPRLSPTKAVDIGWHTFILHTADYAAFCDRIADGFIHHNPICTDDIRSGAALARTMEALESTGYPVDRELWTVDDVAECNQCHATCYNSP